MLETLSHNFGLIATLLGGITAAIVFVKKVYPPMKKLYKGTMSIIDAVPVIEEIATQFKPNGGSTLRDVIDRVEADIQIAKERAWVNYESDERGIFEVDSKGQKCRVNKSWCILTGVSQEDAINGYGWINGIHSLDKERVRHEWDMAIREERTSEMEYMTATGVKVSAVATILRNKQTGKTLGWLGTLTPID
jgi:PAS domain S-box-containing protein